MTAREVRLEPLPEDAYAAWHERQVQGYAESKVRSGNWHSEGALERSRRQLAELLPHGLRTPRNHVYRAVDETSGAVVGSVWLAFDPAEPKLAAYVYDLWIEPALRRGGYGRATLLAAEKEMARRGAVTMDLHVFGFNEGARRMYEAMGYEVTNVNMSKGLV